MTDIRYIQWIFSILIRELRFLGLGGNDSDDRRQRYKINEHFRFPRNCRNWHNFQGVVPGCRREFITAEAIVFRTLTIVAREDKSEFMSLVIVRRASITGVVTTVTFQCKIPLGFLRGRRISNASKCMIRR